MKTQTIEKKHFQMSYFEDWAKDKSPLLATAGLSIAINADFILEFIITLKKQERLEGYIPLPPHKEWLGFYRKHRKVRQGVMSAFKSLDEETAGWVTFFETFLSEFKVPNIQKSIDLFKNMSTEEQYEVFNNVKELYQGIQEYIVADVMNEDLKLDAEEKKRRKKNFTTPEVLFFLKVWAPCAVLYGEYPPKLLWKARHGDDNAFEKLLRLDKNVIHDPKLSELFHQASVDKKRERFDRITKAMRAKPQMKTEGRRIKFYLAGLISNMSIGLKQKLTTVDIHELFDAIAKGKGIDHVDPDLIVTPETFEKAVQRARKLWNVIPLPDKK
ncbi:MAG: hypothetical protein GX625_08325 [Clostridiaceae bacterium]|nr:hypothetical protein [Clostridiaceae bacterium]